MKALVTGGCRGLGLSFSKYLASCGYKVYALFNKSVDLALELENNYDNITCIKCDIRNEKDIENVLFNIDDIDIVINNAGIAKDNEYMNKSKKEFMDVLETNLVGTFLMIKYSIDKMKKDGIIINISSNNALNNYNPISMDYDASKAGVNILTKDFALLDKCKIVSICPGWIGTYEVKNMNPIFLKEEMDKVNQKELLDSDNLVKYIIDNKDKYNNGDIVEIKEI